MSVKGNTKQIPDKRYKNESNVPRLDNKDDARVLRLWLSMMLSHGRYWKMKINSKIWFIYTEILKLNLQVIQILPKKRVILLSLNRENVFSIGLLEFRLKKDDNFCCRLLLGGTLILLITSQILIPINIMWKVISSSMIPFTTEYSGKNELAMKIFENWYI